MTVDKLEYRVDLVSQAVVNCEPLVRVLHERQRRHKLSVVRRWRPEDAIQMGALLEMGPSRGDDCPIVRSQRVVLKKCHRVVNVFDTKVSRDAGLSKADPLRKNEPHPIPSLVALLEFSERVSKRCTDACAGFVSGEHVAQPFVIHWVLPLCGVGT